MLRDFRFSLLPERSNKRRWRDVPNPRQRDVMADSDSAQSPLIDSLDRQDTELELNTLVSNTDRKERGLPFFLFFSSSRDRALCSCFSFRREVDWSSSMSDELSSNRVSMSCSSCMSTRLLDLTLIRVGRRRLSIGVGGGGREDSASSTDTLPTRRSSKVRFSLTKPRRNQSSPLAVTGFSSNARMMRAWLVLKLLPISLKPLSPIRFSVRYSSSNTWFAAKPLASW
mmetsp:Transcript_25753/g.64950  ORF Transcript_25753/g.64950 Transcript_25753/m.64950 type:complete len:227 (-) Transcript_25753:268-948(-)